MIEAIIINRKHVDFPLRKRGGFFVQKSGFAQFLNRCNPLLIVNVIKTKYDELVSANQVGEVCPPAYSHNERISEAKVKK